MLKSILNDPLLSSKATFSIVLLPPSLLSSPSFPFDYLASHVIHVPFESSLSSAISRLKKSDKKKKPALIEDNQDYQLLLTLNDNIVYKTNNGHIIYDSKKVKIVHTELLYTIPENDACTQMLLYLDQPLISTPTTNKQQQEELPLAIVEQPHDLCFKDMMKRILPSKDSNDITKKIDRLVLRFCDTSVICDSLKSLHDCMENILDDGYNLLENLDKTTTIDIDLDKIFGLFESYIMESTYDVAFFKITQFLLPQDKRLTSALEDMEHLDFSQIGLPASITDERKRVHSAISEFERIGSFRTPAEKLDCLLNTISELTKDAASTAAFLDSDSLIPLLLITLIRSKVLHLTANLIYMKEYTFERNIVTGKYGYALSTFEGVLDYILAAHPELSKISKQNVQYWSAIRTGDIDQVVRYDTQHDTRDIYGHNALMTACIHNQPKIVEYFLSKSTASAAATNDMKSTPLMLAIHQGKSLETVKVLLKDLSVVQSVNQSVDKFGNTAVLYACGINSLDILTFLVDTIGNVTLENQINTVTGDSALHVASRNGCSLDVMKYILDFYPPNLLKIKNKKQETFYHLCRNRDCLQYLLLNDVGHNVVYDMIHDIDESGRSPLMTWAWKGRLDLVELIVTKYAGCSRVDKDGRTILHSLAMHLGKGLTYGEKSVDFLIEKLKPSINVRDWIHGNTPLHIAAETSTLASSHNINHAISFVKALLRHGALIDAVNDRDEHPINICRIPELTSCLDELHLKVDPAFAPVMKHSMYQFSWYVTRPWIEQHLDDHQSEIYYIIKSGQIGKPETMRMVKRKLQDFLFLRKELLYEMPEIFLPAFERMPDPLLIDLKPPPLAWIDLTLNKLQTFMCWLQYHPVLRYHDLVISFVRSSSDLQRSVIRDNSFSRRKLLLEKIGDSPLPNNSVMNTKDEEYFLTYAQDMMSPLKNHFLNVSMTGRNMINISQELKRETLMVSQNIKSMADTKLFSPLAIEAIQVCANIMCDRSYVSPWPQIIKASQFAYDMIDGILLSLQRPFWLLNQRGILRTSIEQQKEVLRKSKNWQAIFQQPHLFQPKERKKHTEQDKNKVIQNMNELNHIDSQINQSHKMISDELAHFQNIHPKLIVKSIRKLSRSALEMEKHKLLVLEQIMHKWDSASPSNS